MGKSQQRKGRNAERELCNILQNAGYDVRIGKPVSYGSEPDICGLPFIHVEVKRSEKTHISEWLQQAISDSEKFGDGWPCVFWRRNREGWRVVMQLDDWIQLYSAYLSSEQ